MNRSRAQKLRNIIAPVVLVFLLFGTQVSRVFAEEAALPVGEIEALVGENLSYDIGFLWFERLAEARLSFSKGEKAGIYDAVLEARTLGVAAWLTGNRRQRYMVTMELGENGVFRTRKYAYLKLKGEEGKTRSWTKTYIFDYEKNKVDYIRGKDGRERKRGSFFFKEKSPPADVLTALYNFRRGVYGKTIKRKALIVPTFARGKILEIKIEVAALEKDGLRSFFDSCNPVFKVSVDKDVFDTEGGYVYACFNGNGKPRKGVVENVLGLGNVWGNLKGPQVPAR